MGYKYAYQGDTQSTARAAQTNVAVSTKSAIMVANFVRGKSVERAQRDLGLVLAKKIAVPFTRFTDGAGHKPGIGPGKYPIKASEYMLSAINSAAANARDKGLGDELTIVSVTVHQAARQMRYGRLRGRQRKGTHIEVVVAEAEEKKTRKPATKAKPKAADSTPKADTEPKAADSEPSAEQEPAKKAAKKSTPKADTEPKAVKKAADSTPKAEKKSEEKKE